MSIVDNPFGEEPQQHVFYSDPLSCAPVIAEVQPFDLAAHCRKAQRLSQHITNNTPAHEAIVQNKSDVEAEAVALVGYARKHGIPITPGIPGVLNLIRQHQEAYQSIDPFCRVGGDLIRK